MADITVRNARQVRRDIGSLATNLKRNIQAQVHEQLAADCRSGKAGVRRDTGAMQRNFYGDAAGIHNRQRYANWQEYGTEHIRASYAVRNWSRRHARQYAIQYIVDAIDRIAGGRPTALGNNLTNRDIVAARGRLRSRRNRRRR